MLPGIDVLSGLDTTENFLGKLEQATDTTPGGATNFGRIEAEPGEGGYIGDGQVPRGAGGLAIKVRKSDETGRNTSSHEIRIKRIHFRLSIQSRQLYYSITHITNPNSSRLFRKMAVKCD